MWNKNTNVTNHQQIIVKNINDNLPLGTIVNPQNYVGKEEIIVTLFYIPSIINRIYWLCDQSNQVSLCCLKGIEKRYYNT